MSQKLDVAVIGMACRFPGAADVEEFWANILEGRDTISRSGNASSDPGSSFVHAAGKLNGVECFDAEHFKITPDEASSMDPQQRVLLEVAVTAMEDAGHGAGESDGPDGHVVGVFVGGGEDEYLHEFVAPATGRDPYNDLRLRTGNGKDFLAAKIAFKLGLTGPTITVQAGCATGLVALATACNALIAGDCDIAIAGGVSLVMPDVDGYLHEAGGILSADGYCRPFDRLASGTVPSSGAGLVVLKRNEDALRQGDCRRAIVRGWAVNNDGGSRAGFTVPNVAGQARVIRRALERAGVSSSDVGFLETHGTATAIGDAVEIEAIKQAFSGGRSTPCMLGAVKGNIGHTDAAAGIAGFIKSVLVVERAIIPPLIHLMEVNGNANLTDATLALPTQRQSWPGSGPRVAGVSSFGLGGNNAHVIVGEASGAESVPRSAESAPGPHVIAFSARSQEQLDHLRKETGRWFRERVAMSPAEFADAAYTLAVGRRGFEKRWAVAVADAAAAAAALASPEPAGQHVPRHQLTVSGTAADFYELDGGELHDQPAYLVELARLEALRVPAPGPAGDVARAAMTVLAVIRCLEVLGLRCARIDGPAWLRPALTWHAAGQADPHALTEALRACTRAGASEVEDPGPSAVLRDGIAAPGRVVVDRNFSLPAAAAAAWSSGASVQLAGLYAGQPRRRVPMPTYPFNRHRHWVPRSRGPAAPERPGSVRAGTSNVATLVATVWRDVLGLADIDPEAHFIYDLCGDSMYAVEIGARLNDELGLDLPIDLPFEAPTITLSAAAVADALKEQGRVE